MKSKVRLEFSTLVEKIHMMYVTIEIALILAKTVFKEEKHFSLKWGPGEKLGVIIDC